MKSTAYWTISKYQRERDKRLSRIAKSLNRNVTQDAITEMQISRAVLENLNADMEITGRFI